MVPQLRQSVGEAWWPLMRALACLYLPRRLRWFACQRANANPLVTRDSPSTDLRVVDAWPVCLCVPQTGAKRPGVLDGESVYAAERRPAKEVWSSCLYCPPQIHRPKYSLMLPLRSRRRSRDRKLSRTRPRPLEGKIGIGSPSRRMACQRSNRPVLRNSRPICVRIRGSEPPRRPMFHCDRFRLG